MEHDSRGVDDPAQGLFLLGDDGIHDLIHQGFLVVKAFRVSGKDLLSQVVDGLTNALHDHGAGRSSVK